MTDEALSPKKKKEKEKKKPASKKSEARNARKEKNANKGKQPVPYLLEMVMTFSKATVVLVGLMVAGLSIAGGSSPIWIMIRTSAAVICVGVILWILNTIVAKGILDSEIARVKREHEEAEKAASTLEFKV
jgi:hypothetical protein